MTAGVFQEYDVFFWKEVILCPETNALQCLRQDLSSLDCYLD